MRIAIIGSLLTPIPPLGQGSVELLAYYQALIMAQDGHLVTLFAPMGSKVLHENVHIAGVGESLADFQKQFASNKPEEVYGAAFTIRLRQVNFANLFDLLHKNQNYDVILNNCFDEAPVLASDDRITRPMFHIMHVPILPQAASIFRIHQSNLIPISKAQRGDQPDLHYTQTVYNGVDTEKFSFSASNDNYLLYLGSMGRNKNPKDAMLAAKESGHTLLMGGKIKDRDYYEKELAPLIDGKQIQWVGEKHPDEIIRLYQRAKAFLFPTLWNEPFGLVAIESLSCGTPVIAYPNGGLPEIIKNGVNGYLVKDRAEMVQRIGELDRIDRAVCRKYAEDHFSMDQMVKGYEKVLASAV